MADNEKLDNQRLKNFKNKGRDLEVKVVQIGVSVYGRRCCRRCCVHGQRLPLGSAVTSFLIPTQRGTLLPEPDQDPHILATEDGWPRLGGLPIWVFWFRNPGRPRCLFNNVRKASAG